MVLTRKWDDRACFIFIFFILRIRNMSSRNPGVTPKTGWVPLNFHEHLVPNTQVSRSRCVQFFSVRITAVWDTLLHLVVTTVLDKYFSVTVITPYYICYMRTKYFTIKHYSLSQSPFFKAWVTLPYETNKLIIRIT